MSAANTSTINIQENLSTDIPYSKYFEFFPYQTWSLHHYVTLIIDNYKFPEKTRAHQIFFNILQDIVSNLSISQEIRDFVQDLLNNKKVCIFEVINKI